MILDLFGRNDSVSLNLPPEVESKFGSLPDSLRTGLRGVRISAGDGERDRLGAAQLEGQGFSMSLATPNNGAKCCLDHFGWKWRLMLSS